MGEEEIVAVRRDAIVTSRPVRNLVLADGTTFRIKSAFTSFALLGKIEFYAIPARNVWDIRGIAQDRRRLHANGMALPLVDILGMLERGKVQEAADTLRGLRHDYLARRLPVDFYREFNADSRFCLRYGPAVYRLDEPDEIGIENLEIAYNLRFVIIPLVGVVLS